MRLHGLGDIARAADIVRRALDGGVSAFHVSSEYESWPFFVDVWSEVRRGRDVSGVTFLAKVPGPHFGENAFEPDDFLRRIDVYRRHLDRDRLDVAQWLLRHDLGDEPGRIGIFERDSDLIATTVTDLKEAGVLGGLLCFPYTTAIVERALTVDWCDGLALYVNRFENEYAPFMERAAAKPLGVTAIRPFAAGRVFGEAAQSATEALHYALAQPGVRTVVASVSSVDHLNQALAAVADERTDV